jgi:hypothetical protein
MDDSRSGFVVKGRDDAEFSPRLSSRYLHSVAVLLDQARLISYRAASAMNIHNPTAALEADGQGYHPMFRRRAEIGRVQQAAQAAGARDRRAQAIEISPW